MAVRRNGSFGTESVRMNESLKITNRTDSSLVRLVRSQTRLLPDPLLAVRSLTVSGEEGIEA